MRLTVILCMNRLLAPLTAATVCLLGLANTWGETPSSKPAVTPTPQQREWAEQELGVIIHFDMPTYVPGYNWRQFGTHPAPSVFNPTHLDTDQWLKAARDMGAKYAVLVAKHCSGFSLWPTKAHEYSVKNSPWKNGKGDIVADFVQSCRKMGIKPGIYASTAANGYCYVDNPGKVQPGAKITQQDYNKIVETQLTELWGNYGKLFEVWFDGGVLPISEGGANVSALLKKYQPDAIAFQGPEDHPNLIRWVGNEEGFAPDPCWGTANATTKADGTIKIEGMGGSATGSIWCPGEADLTLRRNSSFQGGWFWTKGQDNTLFSVDDMMHKYICSVGRNTNMLVGIVIDDRGLVPDADVRRLKEFGDRLRQDFANPIVTTQGKGNNLELANPDNRSVRYIVLRERIANGECVLGYKVEWDTGKGWETVFEGQVIGNKRIIQTDGAIPKKVRLTVTDFRGTPDIREFSLY